MHDTVLLERKHSATKLPEVDHGTGSKSRPTTPEKRRSISRTPAFRLDPKTNSQAAHRHEEKPNHTPSVPDDQNDWRGSMKDVPDTDAYDTHLNAFIEENLPQTITHEFQSIEQRRNSEILDAKEKELLTDAELVEYFAERMRQLPLTYGFKSSERYDILQKAMSVKYDKGMNATSRLFGKIQHQRTTNVLPEATRHNILISKTRRKVFLPKIVPTPDNYEHQTSRTGPIITSSFRSSTDRFPKKLGKVPGPGTYDRVPGCPTKKQVGTFLSRGIYFSTSFT